MLALVLSFLLGLYVIKIFFTDWFLFQIQSQPLIDFGAFIDSHLWIYITINTITCFITYYLYVCACSRKKYLNWIWSLVILGVSILSGSLSLYYPNFIMHFNICAMIIIPALNGAKAIDIGIVYAIHGIAQLLSLNIRSLSLLLTNTNYVTIFCLGIESYLWLILLYITFNYKNEKRRI